MSKFDKIDKALETLAWAGILVLGVIIGIGMSIEACHAEDNLPTPDQIDMTYALTYGLVAYKMGLPRMGDFEPPTVQFVPQPVVCLSIGAPKTCKGLGGTTDSRTGRILFSTAFDYRKPEYMTILVHEFVHYFQFVKYGEATDWCENYRRERQAYDVQAEVLNKIGTVAAEYQMHHAMMQSAQARMSMVGNHCKGAL